MKRISIKHESNARSAAAGTMQQLFRLASSARSTANNERGTAGDSAGGFDGGRDEPDGAVHAPEPAQ